MKLLKDTMMYTITFYAIALGIKLIFDFKSVASVFEKGIWTGVGISLSALVLLFLVVLIMKLISKSIFKFKTSKNN
ncbi:hypothetical protein [Sporosarcina sp. FSL K6-1508]|uniref:hypothetical protein n=1 Tax=Sporosarcina sp. FSL K6-1508 TaxID=2921553 RepID=UPI0030F6FA18